MNRLQLYKEKNSRYTLIAKTIALFLLMKKEREKIKNEEII
ncbi:hypothetical protein [Vagococcus fluvialis]|nr:hypothetical protein [Vagococcus fluvialis]